MPDVAPPSASLSDFCCTTTLTHGQGAKLPTPGVPHANGSSSGVLAFVESDELTLHKLRVFGAERLFRSDGPQERPCRPLRLCGCTHSFVEGGDPLEHGETSLCRSALVSECPASCPTIYSGGHWFDQCSRLDGRRQYCDRGFCDWPVGRKPYDHIQSNEW